MSNLEHKIILPDSTLSDFVERFWMVKNSSNLDIPIVIVPDGRFDLLFTFSDDGSIASFVIGIEKEPSQHLVTKGTIIMGVGLKLLAVEYILKYSIAPIIGKMKPLISPNFGVLESDLNHFENFCNKIEIVFKKIIPQNIDEKKQTLFNILFETNGSLKIQEYAEKCYWSSRQINRYFTQWFGLSLKEYCKILRFKASANQIKEGKFFPEQNYSDQPHFIREVKKLTGVTPKELFKRQSDRFIQL